MIYPKRQISVNGVYAVIDCTRPQNYRFEGESHPFWEFVFVRDGKAGASAEERIYTLSKGSILFHKPMEFHRIWSLEDTSPKLYIFSFEASGNLVRSLESLSLRLDEGGEKTLDKLVKLSRRAFEVYGEGGLKSARNEVLVQEYCNTLELFLLSLVRETPEMILPADSSPDSRLFSQVVMYLRENISSKMTVEQIAEQFFVSPSRIKKLFSRYSGLGVMAYFNNMKIIEAQKLLDEGFRIGEVSEKLGFSNQFYFSTVFKKVLGISPTQFKRA